MKMIDFLNENFKFTGDITIGRVGNGVILEVDDGGVLIKGSVGENAKIIQKGGNFSIGGNNNINICGSGQSVNIVNGEVWIDGKKAGDNGGARKSELEYSVQIDGILGPGASVKGTGNIRIKNISPEAEISAGNNLEIENMAGGTADAGNNVKVSGKIMNAIIHAGNNFRQELYGNGIASSTINAVNNIKTNANISNCVLEAGNNIHAAAVLTSKLTAENNIDVESINADTITKAGNKIKIRQR